MQHTQNPESTPGIWPNGCFQTRGPWWMLPLRVSSLVRFYKSRFWFFSENFRKNFWIKFLKNFWIQRFSAANHSKMKETSCFAAIFKFFTLLFSNFDEFQKFFRFFLEISENFLKKIWNISEKLWIQKFSAANHSKMKETSCFAAVFKLFCCYFHTFCVAFLEFWRLSEIFQIFFRQFSEIFQIFFRNFWKISEIFLKNLCIQKFSAANHLKMKETSCFAAVFKLFCCYFQTFCVAFLEFWRISEFFQKFFRKFSDFFQKFFRNSWKFSKIFWNISEKIMNPEIFCCQPFKNEGNALLLFSKFSASFSYFWQFPGTKSGGKLAVLLLFSNFFALLFSNFDEFQIFFRNFSENFQIFFRNFWKIYESRNFLLPTIQKWRKLAVLLLFSKFSASFSLLLAVLLLFSNFLRCFSRILTNFRNFPDFFRKFSEFFHKFSEISEKFLKYFWKIYESRDFLLPTIQKWRKLAVLPLLSKFSASFSLLLAVLLLFSNFLRCFSRILTNFRKFSEIFQKFLKIFWKISEKFMNPEIFCCQPFKNEGN